MDCGPACLQMVSNYYGKHFNTAGIKSNAGFNKEGTSMLGLSEAAEKIGFRTRGVQLTYGQLIENVPLPCILHWDQYHFVVFLPISRWRKRVLRIADPAKGILEFTKKEFLTSWISSSTEMGEMLGTALLLEPSQFFYKQKGEKENGISWKFVLQYFLQHKRSIIQIFASLLIGSIIQLIFPFLTQTIVDVGIGTQNLHFITIVLIGQMVLIFSKTFIDFIRSRLLLQISSVINLSILSDFWIKLTRLPMSYFDSHHTGDTMQRLSDHKQIQNFLTGTALNTLFSMLNFLVLGVVLAWYNINLFLILVSGTVLYFSWVKLFLHVKRKINYQTFRVSSKENNATLQLVQGMQEIKLNGAEQLKRWEWENIQNSIVKLNFRNLNYNQIQQAGALVINQGKDIIITFLVARMVIEGSLTFGSMLAIQFILGQLGGPIEQFILFVQSAQDAKISLERLNEVHELEEEEVIDKEYIHILPENKTIQFRDVSFSYPGAGNALVLNRINLEIPTGKVTAIVGVSGSGKTTLLKLLLKFYEFHSGEIKVGPVNFKYFSPATWRKKCGSVLQDGYIFNDTIARNIAVGDDFIDLEKLINACKIANVLSFIDSLPNGFYTLLGVAGIGISQGQKQRLLIARAVYKEPDYLFFDEATNSLDANNEKVIIENLEEIFNGRTVVVVAHRLSTVKNAHKIVVLHEGAISEEGTHQYLTSSKGRYFELVRNQLELGN